MPRVARKGVIMADEVKVEEAPKASGKKSGTGLEPNVAAMLAYLFGWLSGLIIFLIEKDDKFVRFAAMQSIVLSLGAMVISFVLSWIIGMIAFATILGGGFAFAGILGLVSWALWIGFFVLWIMLMVKAYQGQEWELPVIGKIARGFIK